MRRIVRTRDVELRFSVAVHECMRRVCNTNPCCFFFYHSLYGRHMQADPEPPKKNNDKTKKISRKPLAAKNK